METHRRPDLMVGSGSSVRSLEALSRYNPKSHGEMAHPYILMRDSDAPVYYRQHLDDQLRTAKVFALGGEDAGYRPDRY